MFLRTWPPCSEEHGFHVLKNMVSCSEKHGFGTWKPCSSELLLGSERLPGASGQPNQEQPDPAREGGGEGRVWGAATRPSQERPEGRGRSRGSSQAGPAQPGAARRSQEQP